MLTFVQRTRVVNIRQIHKSLGRWYEQNKRVLPWRETRSAYRIWLSEIILQQTRVQQGLEYYLRFIKQFPDVHTLAEASEDEVLLLWQGLGYYSRARNLHKAAKMIVDNGWEPFPNTFEQVVALPGVGEYTAGAIMSFAYDAPYPAADGNVYRVLSRLYDCEEPFDTTAGKKRFRTFAWEILDKEHPRLHNSALMEFGALYCTPTGMDCAHCPIGDSCLANLHGTAELLPVRKQRPAVRDRYFHYTVYRTPDGMTLLHQRTEKDIWQHLWEFVLEETENAFTDTNGRSFTHVLSHQRLHVLFTEKKVETLPLINGCVPIPWTDLHRYALSRLTMRYLESLV